MPAVHLLKSLFCYFLHFTRSLISVLFLFLFIFDRVSIFPFTLFDCRCLAFCTVFISRYRHNRQKLLLISLTREFDFSLTRREFCNASMERFSSTSTETVLQLTINYTHTDASVKQTTCRGMYQKIDTCTRSVVHDLTAYILCIEIVMHLLHNLRNAKRERNYA